MDFVERWFGISPDGGNGTFEVLLVVVATAVVFALVCLTNLIGSAQRRSQGSVRTID